MAGDPKITTFRTKESLLARRQEAFSLRVAGYTFRQIADHMGISEPSAWNLIRRESKRREKELAEHHSTLRQIAHDRHETIIRRNWVKAIGSTKTVNGQTVEIPPDDAATARVLKAMQSDAALLGYAAPQKVQVDLTVVNTCIGIVFEKVIDAIPEELAEVVHAALQIGIGEVASLYPALAAQVAAGGSMGGLPSSEGDPDGEEDPEVLDAEVVSPGE